MNELKKHYEELVNLHYEIMTHTNAISDIIGHSDRRLSKLWMMMTNANDLFKFAIDEFDKEILPF